MKSIDESDFEKIDHCVMLFGGVKLMIEDDTEGISITKGNNVSLPQTCENVQDTKSIYDKLIELVAGI